MNNIIWPDFTKIPTVQNPQFGAGLQADDGGQADHRRRA